MICSLHSGISDDSAPDHGSGIAGRLRSKIVLMMMNDDGTVQNIGEVNTMKNEIEDRRTKGEL